MAIRYNALYLDLLEDLSDHLPSTLYSEDTVECAEEWPDMSLKQFRALQLAKSFFKKLEDRTGPEADRVALDKFLQSNIQCRDWTLRLESSVDEQLLGSFIQKIYNFYWLTGVDSILDSFDTILDRGRVGPGASIGAHGTDFYTKMFAGPLSTTSEDLYSTYEHYIERIPNWYAAEQLRYDQFGGPRVVEGNRLSYVPKNRNTSRVICTEPVLNMFYQLGIGEVLTGRLRSSFGIDLSIQPEINQLLARRGSLYGDYCTIDLKAASDSVSLAMLRETLPASFMAWLELVRSPVTTLPDGRVQELDMVSSMGNGFTFPLQTAIFCCVVSAAYDALGIKRRRNYRSIRDGNYVLLPGNFGVFGDDIIVETRAYETVVRLLNILGFQVNAEKSFHEGRFRESCGGDFYSGHPTRGVYIKSLATPASRYVAINRLNEWSSVSNISLPRTITRLLKSVRYLPVPLAEANDAGIRVPFSMVRHELERRNLETENYGSIVYRIWAVEPKFLRFVDGDIRVPKGQRKRMYNAPGALEAFLRGDIRSDSLSIRLDAPRYRTYEAITPFWDYLPSVDRQLSISQARLASAIRTNLTS